MNKYGPPIIDKVLSKELRRRENQKRDTFAKRLYYPFFKRFADIFCSLICLVILLILLPAIIIAIKLDSKGPIFFSQIRVGQFGTLFKIYKLRTMRVDAEKLIDNTTFKEKNNPFVQCQDDFRVTRVGKFLRHFSIDELPQLFCVLKGDMSFIGPRPFIPKEVEMLRTEHLYRLIVKPGLTGLAQISGRNKLNLQERMEKDLYYIENMSAWMDIKILFKTILKVADRDGAC